MFESELQQGIVIQQDFRIQLEESVQINPETKKKIGDHPVLVLEFPDVKMAKRLYTSSIKIRNERSFHVRS